MKRDLIIAI